MVAAVAPVHEDSAEYLPGKLEGGRTRRIIGGTSATPDIKVRGSRRFVLLLINNSLLQQQYRRPTSINTLRLPLRAARDSL